MGRYGFAEGLLDLLELVAWATGAISVAAGVYLLTQEGLRVSGATLLAGSVLGTATLLALARVGLAILDIARAAQAGAGRQAPPAEPPVRLGPPAAQQARSATTWGRGFSCPRCRAPRRSWLTGARTPTGSAGPWPIGASPPASQAGRAATSPPPHDPALCRQRHRIENMFGRRKDWRRVATRCDRCPIFDPSACAPAAIVMFWL